MYGVIIILLLTVGVFILFEKITEYLLTRLPHINAVTSEFPTIDERSIEKFTSFDPELGWERKPNEQRKKDTGHQNPDDPTANKVVYSTDEFGSRVCQVDRDINEFNIATYGDSYCFCREVSDNGTIQHYLSQELGAHVSNYGVGNYGLDQTILRMKRRFEDDPAEYVILILDDCVSIGRIVSAWKHYFEFGNTFAVKPRYKLVDGELQKIPIPIDKKRDLLTLEESSTYLRENDYHYRNWFLPHLVSRPYSKVWVQDWANGPYAVFSTLEYLSRNKQYLGRFHKFMRKQQYKYVEQKENMEWEYRAHLREQHMGLFCALLSEFANYIRSHGSTPIFLPVRDPKIYRTDMNVDPLGESCINKIKSECPNLRIIDPRKDIISRVDRPNDLYVKSNPPGGHPNELHNKLNAKILSKHIRDLQSKY